MIIYYKSCIYIFVLKQYYSKINIENYWHNTKACSWLLTLIFITKINIYIKFNFSIFKINKLTTN